MVLVSGHLPALHVPHSPLSPMSSELTGSSLPGQLPLRNTWRLALHGCGSAKQSCRKAGRIGGTAFTSVHCGSEPARAEVDENRSHGCKPARQEQDDARRHSRREAIAAAAAAAAVVVVNVPSPVAGGSWLLPPAALALGGSGSPAAEDAVRRAVRSAVSPPKAAAVLRLAFHDAGTFDSSRGTGGMNGSILYELERPESVGLKRAVKALEKARLELDPSMGAISWADLIAVAGAESVAMCGGPQIPVRLGRLDSGVPDEEGQMPEETLSAPALKESFRRKGFTAQEMVALSGAHTLGSKGFGDPVVFDNSYYTILLQKPWMAATGGNSMSGMIGLPTDRAIAGDAECLYWIKVYARSASRFFDDFSAAYSKLVESGAKWDQSPGLSA